MKQSNVVIIIGIILGFIMSLTTLYFRKYPYQGNQSDINNQSGTNDTGGLNIDISEIIGGSGDFIEDNIGEFAKDLIINQEGYETLSLNDFPKIKVINPIKNVKLVAEISFTDNFIKMYKYEDSTGYFFGLKFFIGDFKNGGYYGVYRKKNGAVGNSSNRGLVGAKLAYEIRDGVTWYIDLTDQVPIAVDADKWKDNYQYQYIDIINYINTHLGAELPIGVYLSSVTEKQGREITKIKSLKLVYVGRESDVEVISN